MRPPLLILAVGNPSRGDDALGPELLLQLEAAGLSAQGDVELLSDFQLQVEHALDLADRHAVLFVDAAHPGTVAGVALYPLLPALQAPRHSHALSAPEVLQVAQGLGLALPAAWQLALEGQCFALGAGLSPAARKHLAHALPKVQAWVQARRAGLAPATTRPESLRATPPPAPGAGGCAHTVPVRAGDG